MKSMRSVLAVLLTLALAMPLCLSGCGGREAGPLRILLDVEEDAGQSRTAAAVDALLEEIAAQGGPADVEAEYLPRTGTERKNAITKLRTEIMSGRGPDMFIISGCRGEQDDDGLLFPFPEKSALNGLFMPLDGYIEKARFAMWKDFNETVMEAGRTEKGQMLVPLSYTFPVTCFPKMEVSHFHSKELTWDDMLNDESLIMKAAAALEQGEGALDDSSFDAVMGKTADYRAEELLFTEDELIEYAHKQLALYEEDGRESFAGLPEHYHGYARPWFSRDGGDMTVIPQYNKDGGVTATVFHYACINANSRRGEDAFFILDYILSRDGSFSGTEDNTYMRGESWRQVFYSLFTGSAGLPADSGMEWSSVYEGYVSAGNRAAMDAAARCVTAVNVYGKLNRMLSRMMDGCQGLEGGPDELIRETYRVMCMELKES